MAEIFLAASRGPEGFEKEVVIKRIRSALADDPSFVQMFIAEARVASKLNHPNIVHIFDFDQHSDSYYLAMEYVRGKSLAEVQRRTRERQSHFPTVLAAQVALEVARGLAYAHKMTDHGQPLNLVHRDVTPHNILISYDGSVKLTDFGIAKAGNRATTAGMLKGKFAYMSPEQSRGEPVDARTDIFALGITLWELLTQGKLFDGDSDVAVLRAVQERPIESPAHLNPSVDPELDAIVLRALLRDPAARYQNAHEFERALQQYVIHHTRSPEDADVGAYLREIFAEEFQADQTEPEVPLQLLTPPPGRSSAEGLAARGGTPSVGMAPVGMDTAAYAFTARQSGKQAPAGTPTGGRVPSVVTQRSPVGTGSLAAAAGLGGARRFLAPSLVACGLFAALCAVFLLGRGTSSVAPAAVPASAVQPRSPEAPTPLQAASLPPATQPPVAVPAAPSPPAPVGPPGFLTVEATPWGKLIIDGKSYGDIEGVSKRIPLSPGSHEVRLVNRKTKSWPVTIESGKTRQLKYNFITD
jgi:eukaryotic-like serine/threonine-protein kinase